MLSEVRALEAIRLTRDWTFAELSAAMAKLDLYVSPRTLHYLVKEMPREAKPFDRTMFKLQKFLAHMKRLDAQAHSRRRRKALTKERGTTLSKDRSPESGTSDSLVR